MLALLRQDPGSSFSDLWYRVGPTRPRVSTHARITVQRRDDSVSYIIEDPAGGNFYRLSESAYFFIGFLDGKRTVQDAWDACNAQRGDDAPTQRECIDVLSKLQYFGLLGGELPLAADMIERRHREAAKRRMKLRTGSGLSLVLPLFNPERVLERCKHLIAPIFSRAGLAVYLLVVLAGLYSVLTNIPALFSSLNGVLEPANLVQMAVLFMLIRAWHELGHACACKAMGGRCTEIGMMLVAYIIPFPYCDTSDAWRFSPVWKRVMVSCGGMLFETFVAGIAAVIWAHADDSANTLRTLTYNIMLISGVTTLVFNANPLMRYDGYYILSDVLGSPNLAQRGGELLRFLTLRHAFKVTSAQPPAVRDDTEFWVLLVYQVMATPYRIIVSMGIVLFLWSDQRYFTLGAVLAIAAGCMWVAWPLLKGLGFLAASPVLLGRRSRAVGISAAALAAVLLVTGLIPFPAPAYAPGIIEPAAQEPIRAGEDGFIEEFKVQEGDRVKPGDVLLTMRNPQVMAELARAQADYAKALSYSDAASADVPQEHTISAIRVEQMAGALARAQQKADALTVRSGIAGRVAPMPKSQIRLRDLAGRYVTHGSLMGLVISDQLTVRSAVADREQAYIFDASRRAAPTASIRVRGDAGRVVPASVIRVAPVGSREVTNRSLTTDAGGEVVLDPRDPERKTSLTPQFVVELVPQTPQTGWQPGLRANVRFDTAPRPLLAQWWRSLRQYLGDKVRA
ncbi:MAG: biotin/lipoyl-binding protein [Planctomycetes bacterium]|nr:biotin/lipoyl-binding protein [Planctomycetota bacterium]